MLPKSSEIPEKRRRPKGDHHCGKDNQTLVVSSVMIRSWCNFAFVPGILEGKTKKEGSERGRTRYDALHRVPVCHSGAFHVKLQLLSSFLDTGVGGSKRRQRCWRSAYPGLISNVELWSPMPEAIDACKCRFQSCTCNRWLDSLNHVQLFSGRTSD